ncbi:hypothetical protein FHG87_010197 [Trinorchestia longiramus]|nr:hypothetical protein FHG87_010197 [Trinorchestia longiramus]
MVTVVIKACYLVQCPANVTSPAHRPCFTGTANARRSDKITTFEERDPGNLNRFNLAEATHRSDRGTHGNLSFTAPQ